MRSRAVHALVLLQCLVTKVLSLSARRATCAVCVGVQALALTELALHERALLGQVKDSAESKPARTKAALLGDRAAKKSAQQSKELAAAQGQVRLLAPAALHNVMRLSRPALQKGWQLLQSAE